MGMDMDMVLGVLSSHGRRFFTWASFPILAAEAIVGEIHAAEGEVVGQRKLLISFAEEGKK